MPATSAAPAREALLSATEALRAAGVDTPRLDAEVLLCEATGWDRAQIAANPEAGITPAAGREFGALVRRRLQREPVAYIVGSRGFRTIELCVDRRVLIPRPETELLVDVALERSPRTVLDLGTGSGAVALAVATELPRCSVTACDTSAAALDVARLNAAALGLDRVEFHHGSVPPGQSFDLVLANLPYVAEGDWPGLAPEITRWEPPEALLAGPDGLDAFRGVLPELSATTVALEVGAGQAAAVAGLLASAGFVETEARRDLAGIERVVIGVR